MATLVMRDGSLHCITSILAFNTREYVIVTAQSKMARFHNRIRVIFSCISPFPLYRGLGYDTESVIVRI